MLYSLFGSGSLTMLTLLGVCRPQVSFLGNVSQCKGSVFFYKIYLRKGLFFHKISLCKGLCFTTPPYARSVFQKKILRKGLFFHKISLCKRLCFTTVPYARSVFHKISRHKGRFFTKSLIQGFIFGYYGRNLSFTLA